MPPKGVRQLERKKLLRQGHRLSVKRLITSAEQFITNLTDEVVPKLLGVKANLEEKLQKLLSLDSEIVSVISEDEVVEEIEETDAHNDVVNSVLLQIDSALQKLNQDLALDLEGEHEPDREQENTGAVTQQPQVAQDEGKRPLNRPTSTAATGGSNVKLPKLELPTFDGNITKWNLFWDSFKHAVHENTSLAPINKFNYLNSCLKSKGADAINGLKLTSDNYDQAILILKRRFGDNQKIINQLMEELLSMAAATSSLTSLRGLYDGIESKIRSLQSLGVESQSYGSLLAPVVMAKLPQEIKLVISRDIKDGTWNLDSILEIYLKELEARERANKLTDNDNQSRGRTQVGSAVSLLVNNFQTCTYCKGRHTSNSCQVVTTILDRKSILTRWGKCFICLRKGHLARNCPDRKNCPKCGENHHISICPRNFNRNPNYPMHNQMQYQPSRSSYNTLNNGPNPNNFVNSRQFGTVPNRQDNRNFGNQNQPMAPRNDFRLPSQDIRSNGRLSSYSQSQGSRGDRSNSSMNSSVNFSSPSNNFQQTDISLYAANKRNPVLLQTARTFAFLPGFPDNKVTARLIFDGGSQSTYICQRVKDVLNLPVTNKESVMINTFGSKSDNAKLLETVDVGLVTKNGDKLLSGFVVPHICDPLQYQPIMQAKTSYKHLAGLQLADYVTDENDIQIDILVGADQQWNFYTGRVTRGEFGPVALETTLGWVLSGPVHNQSHNMMTLSKITSLFTSETRLDDQLKSFWELESLGIKPKSVYEDFLETIEFKEGRYEVSLPWKVPHLFLPDNFDVCYKRLTSLLQKLRKDPDIFREYSAVIEEQLQKGIVEEVTDPNLGEPGKVHYLPHHCVIRTDKETTKLRVVYNGSSKTTGPSLNDCLYAGPPLNEHILDLLLRFRIHPVAVVADIEKAFLMVSINPEDRDVLRFLWINDRSEVVSLRFARVVFGVSSSPFLLNATIRQHIEQFDDTDPDFVRTFLRSIYVDDLSTGAKDDETAYNLYHKSKLKLAEGGFNLRKFVSNSKSLSEKIYTEENYLNEHTTKDDTKSKVIEDNDSYSKSMFDQPTLNNQKILGVGWNSSEDQLVFDLKSIAEYAKNIIPNKRNVVAVSSKFYDPLGLLSPFIIQFKILFQDICRLGLEWDDPIEDELLKRFNKLIDVMLTTKRFYLARCYFNKVPEDLIEINLHGFSDASLKGYAAVVYLQLITSTGNYTRFLVSKTRVAPLDQQSIPRLELLSTLILSRLIVSIKKAFAFELTINNVVCWSDSKVALFWIKNQNREWKQFVQNRVNEIRTLIDTNCFYHCPGKENPADIPSRGMDPQEFLSTNNLWLNGPIWLRDYKLYCEPEFEDVDSDDCLQEAKKIKNNAVLLIPVYNYGIGQIIQCHNFSDYNKLISITALVLRFIQTLKRKIQHETHIDYISKSEQLWLIENQKTLKSNIKFDKWDTEFKLFIDENGIIRCAGRLGKSELSYSTKYPVLLDSSHWLTTLITRDAHKKILHGGVKSTLAEIRSKYWIIKGRQFIRKIIYDCVICRRFNSKAFLPPPPPDLPEFRVTEASAFTYTGLDYIGPLMSKDDGKKWICLFTCCVTRAVHLELVSNLTPEAFLRCFRRFASRRSVPQLIVSDNASTFKPAARELIKLMESPDVKMYLSNKRIKWSYNLAKAPWWGGFYERLVKLVKDCLKKTLGQAQLSFDELHTIVNEVEAVLNSRPLSYTTVDDLEEALTPSHLIYGYRLMSLPDPNINHINDDIPEVNQSDLSRRMKYLHTVLQHFWSRWSKEYLIELRNAHRLVHKSNGIPINIGDVVLVHDEQLPRGFWKLGRVHSFVDSQDGQVRGAVVKIRTKTGKINMLRRPIQLLYPLEIHLSDSNGKDTHDEEQVPGNIPMVEPEIVIDNNPMVEPQVIDNIPMVEPQVIDNESKPDMVPRRPKRTAAVVGENIRRKWIKDLQSSIHKL